MRGPPGPRPPQGTPSQPPRPRRRCQHPADPTDAVGCEQALPPSASPRPSASAPPPSPPRTPWAWVPPLRTRHMTPSPLWPLSPATPAAIPSAVGVARRSDAGQAGGCRPEQRERPAQEATGDALADQRGPGATPRPPEWALRGPRTTAAGDAGSKRLSGPSLCPLRLPLPRDDTQCVPGPRTPEAPSQGAVRRHPR